MMKKEIIIAYLVKRLREQYIDMQISKTKVQKLVYLLGDKIDVDFNYSMYHFGPNSSHTAIALSCAKDYGYIDMTWDPRKGFFIEPTGKLIDVDPQVKDAVDKVVERYGGYDAIELMIISTGKHIRRHFECADGFVDTVSTLKPDFDKTEVRALLAKENLI